MRKLFRRPSLIQIRQVRIKPEVSTILVAVFQQLIQVKTAILIFRQKMFSAAAALIFLAPKIVSATDCRLFTVGECAPSNDIWVGEVTLLSNALSSLFNVFMQICSTHVALLSLHKYHLNILPICFHFLSFTRWSCHVQAMSTSASRRARCSARWTASATSSATASPSSSAP